MHKSDETEDLRKRRTRKLLQDAFIELTIEKGFAAVSIRDITERAMVNRSTFYRHYLDKYELLEQYMDEMYALIETTDDRADTAVGAPPGLIRLIKHIQQFGDFYRVMLGPKGDLAFTERFRKNHENRFRALFSSMVKKTDSNEPPLDLKLGYVSHAGIGAIVWWLESGQPCSPEELAVWLSKLSSRVMGWS